MDTKNITILFASTNEDKIRRLSLLTKKIRQEKNITFISLKQAGLDNVDEPVESGNNELENATIKAIYYASCANELAKFDYVLSQDDGVYNKDIPEEYRAGKDVKATVARYMGGSSFEDIYNYWLKIGRMYPNSAMEFVWGFSLVKVNNNLNPTVIGQAKVSIESVINSERIGLTDKISLGSPISPVTLISIDGKKEYFSDLTDDMYQLLADDKCSNLNNLLKKVD